MSLAMIPSSPSPYPPPLPLCSGQHPRDIGSPAFMAVKWAKNLPVFSNLPFRGLHTHEAGPVSLGWGAHLLVQVMTGGGR